MFYAKSDVLGGLSMQNSQIHDSLELETRDMTTKDVNLLISESHFAGQLFS